MIKVVNKHKHDSTSSDFYIGRGSPLGNPYSSKESSKEYVEKVESREKAIKKYKSWLREKVQDGDEEIIKELYKILKHEEKEDRVNLVCFCKPKACHGDVIKEFLKKAKDYVEI